MLKADGRYLLLDASSPTLHAGIIDRGQWSVLISQEGDALEHVSGLVGEVMKRAEVRFEELSGLIHCEGPGGLLGLRLAAMSVESWHSLPNLAEKPLYVYRSLSVAAAARVLEAGGVSFTLLSPFRKGLWNYCTNTDFSLQLCETEALEGLPRPHLCIPQRHLKALPGDATPTEYRVDNFPNVMTQYPHLLAKADRARVFVPEENDYKLWSGDRHRA